MKKHLTAILTAFAILAPASAFAVPSIAAKPMQEAASSVTNAVKPAGNVIEVRNHGKKYRYYDYRTKRYYYSNRRHDRRYYGKSRRYYKKGPPPYYYHSRPHREYRHYGR